MAVKQIHKRSLKYGVIRRDETPKFDAIGDAISKIKGTSSKKNNKKVKEGKDMTLEQVEMAAELANFDYEKKVAKKDKSLIERTESSKIVLAEDNRQVLND